MSTRHHIQSSISVPRGGRGARDENEDETDAESFEMHYELVESTPSMDVATDDKKQRPIVVVIHGGPGLPSDYLRHPLQRALGDGGGGGDGVGGDRTLLFYDQVGCGRSEEPREASSKYYGIDWLVNDLKLLLEKVERDRQVSSYHLYGHSFGGILAYEFLKQVRPSNCRSVVLSSTPSSIPECNRECDRLMRLITEERQTARRAFHPRQLDDVLFRRRHVCRTWFLPRPLKRAYDNAGTVWSGTDVIADYVATPPSSTILTTTMSSSPPLSSPSSSRAFPPTLVLRGEHDFCTAQNQAGWKDCYSVNSDNNGNDKNWNGAILTFRDLPGCSHHALLERPRQYGHVLGEFWRAHDGDDDNKQGK